MNLHDAWRSDAAPATGERLVMDDLTASQLADELTTLASSMFGLLQLPPGADPAQAESEAAFETALAQAIPVADPASVVSVAIPAAPVVEVAVAEDWETPEPEAQETPDVPALAVPALALPELPEGLDKLDQREPEPDQREPEPEGADEPEAAPRHRSMAALNEIAFLDD